nr:MAG TPA: hypothetical protein [Caudoviricetes sp.]
MFSLTCARQPTHCLSSKTFTLLQQLLYHKHV